MPDGIDSAVGAAADPRQGAIISLPEFIELAGELTADERRLIVEQAMLLIDEIYVHLPLKRAMHAIDPVQQLKILRRSLGHLSERRFHNEMIEIFKGLRDLHTNYILPFPYRAHTAFLPFVMAEFYDDTGERHYIVTSVFRDTPDPQFVPGVEILTWSGVPVDRAVELNADREAGSNEPARHVRGLDDMTIRPMLMSLPPDEQWVIVGYRTEAGDEREVRLPWQIFRPDTSPAPAPEAVAGSAEANLITTSMGIDVVMDARNHARRVLFSPESVDRREVADTMRAEGMRAGSAFETFKAENSLFPETFEFRTVDTPSGTFGYLRIFTFGEPGPEEFINEVVRIIEDLPGNGLIIDVRGNGGGIILNGERMLQLFTDRRVEAERLHFINTEVTAAIARSPVFGGFAQRWIRSIDLSEVTGATYSQGFPIEPNEVTNAIGRRYPGNVVLVTDARCYSTTDIFAAGFQDNGLGPILGVDANTGAGGANVFTHELLQMTLSGPDSPIVPLPNGADMRVAIRRTTRVGENSGLPLEDLGVIPDEIHRLTRRDVLEDGHDLIERAAELLAGGPPIV